MLKLVANPTFKGPVKIRAPGGETFTVVFEFKHRTKDALAGFFKSDEWLKKTDAQNIMSLASGWTGVDAEFNEENLRTLCDNYHAAASDVVNAYINELTGARLGN